MDIEQEYFAKTRYLTLDGYVSSAYFDTRTGIGENKHSGVPVKIFWSDEHGAYHEELFMVPEMPEAPRPPFVRVQPKRRLSRKKRKAKGKS